MTMPGTAIVYLVVNAANGGRYVGVTRLTLQQRKARHLSEARRGRGWRLHAAIRKYGEQSFEFSEMEKCASYEEALQREVEIIRDLKPEYNVTAGGEGRVAPLAPAVIERLRKANCGKPGSFLGRKHTSESIERMRAAATGRVSPMRGKPRSPDTVAKMSARARENPSRYWLGKPRTEETKAKIRASKTGVARSKPSNSAIAIFVENMRRAARNRRRPIMCVDDLRMFNSATEAGDYYGLSKATISAVATGRRNSAYGKRFVYIEAAP